MRHAFAIGAFALLVSGLGGIAQAHSSVAPQVDYTGSTQSADAASVSPDVAEWTSHLIMGAPPRRHAGLGRFTGGILARTSRIAQGLTRSALRFLGVPYVFGGTSTSGFDCSGFVQHVFAMMGIALPRTADAQYDVGRPSVGGPRAGDLVFFDTYGGVSHVGIYLGAGEFVHASSSHGVMVSHLSDSYWAARYVGSKRFVATR
ncbi:MAG TPA: C40 family peptidase [Candidatus Cybelea sp.]|nr:C40 family peptidase [Candidatus Cybelea sp.]